MAQFRFPKPFEHTHPPVQNVNQIYNEQLTFGEKAADTVANAVGSWKFIIIQSFLLVLWVIFNSLALINHWDPYPFILMNLVLSTQAAFATPIIMMSQNRQADKDRMEVHNEYLLAQKTEEELRAVLDHLAAQDKALEHIYQLLTELKTAQADKNE